METVLLYFGKVIVCSGVTFLYYRLSLKDKTFHHYNRFYLLSAMLISILLPVIRIEDFTVEVSSNIYRLIDTVQVFNKNSGHDYIYFRIILSAVGLVSLFYLGRFIHGIIKIRQLKTQFYKETFDGINFYSTDLNDAPFSYFRNLFWKNSIMLNSDVGKQILKHEMVHIEQKHSSDKVFIEILTAVFWFNPFFHIIKKEISLIHEYLADHKAVRQSDTKAFAQMLLASHFSGTALPAASPFLSSNLKKRLKMLQKPKTKFGYVRRIFALPVVFSVAFAYLVNAKNQEIKATNIEIEKAVSQIKKEDKTIIKKDTIAPKPKNNTAVSPKDVKENQKRISALHKDIAEKGKGLKDLEPDSEEFQAKVKEIAVLAAETVKMSDDEMMHTLDQDFKINKKVKKTVDWEIITRSEPRTREMSDFNFNFPNISPTSPNAPKVKVYTFKDSGDMKWSPEMEKSFRLSESNATESAATAKKRAKLEKERAKLEEKRAKLEGEKAKLEAERRALDGNRKVYIYSNTIKGLQDDKFFKLTATNNIRINHKKNSMLTSGTKNVKGTEDIKIYFDGKEITDQEMQALDPGKIERMNIYKKTVDGGMTTGEIRIEAKK
ncbi:M56 family metallopeptidase [Chryseobacterium sp. SSA4.19]|uniref:M56 family metallopeptidase n=1 Tax=Chryseobacterium sp. SSA4.19 TaxID=2919915 RepID=UPI001F4E8C3A|nr:M56 family metallopeptidase [Chryseobacterium sp. SSA4.19]MCJ8154882.1 M56 family metallopeptidase [Chryseobacterium sp. SSA4.19]